MIAHRQRNIPLSLPISPPAVAGEEGGVCTQHVHPQVSQARQVVPAEACVGEVEEDALCVVGERTFLVIVVLVVGFFVVDRDADACADADGVGEGDDGYADAGHV